MKKDAGWKTEGSLGRQALKIAPRAGELACEAAFRDMLAAALPVSVRVFFTANRRQLVSVARQRDGSLTVRLQHAFRAADAETFGALVRFLRRPDASSKAQLAAFAESRSGLFEALSDPPRKPRPASAPRTRGRFRDLALVLKKVLSDHGLAVPGLAISWSAAPGNGESPSRGGSAGRRSIRFGSYCAGRKLIRIHPLLDSPDFPAYFTEYVVYHEVLHALYPPKANGARRSVHTPEFRARERMFIRYDEAREFEKRWRLAFFGGPLRCGGRNRQSV